MINRSKYHWSPLSLLFIVDQSLNHFTSLYVKGSSPAPKVHRKFLTFHHFPSKVQMRHNYKWGSQWMVVSLVQSVAIWNERQFICHQCILDRVAKQHRSMIGNISPPKERIKKKERNYCCIEILKSDQKSLKKYSINIQCLDIIFPGIFVIIQTSALS